MNNEQTFTKQKTCSTGRVLGVAADASAPEVKAAYRAAALREHPDVSAAPDAEQRFRELSTAYGVALRLQYPSRLRLWSMGAEPGTGSVATYVPNGINCCNALCQAKRAHEQRKAAETVGSVSGGRGV